MEINTARFLLVIPDYLGSKKADNSLYLINYEGKIHLRTQNIFHESLEYAPVVSTNKNPSEIYGWQGDNDLIKLDHQFKPLHQVSTPFKNIRPIICKDLNADGNEEVICISENFLTIFDQELNLLSIFHIPNRRLSINFRENGTNKPLEIGLKTNENFYRLSHVKNKIYSFFPLFFLGLTGIVFMLLLGIHKGSMILNIYVRFFKHYIHNGSEAILIVNRQGKIFYSNSQLQQLLKLRSALKKGDILDPLLRQYPVFGGLFREGLRSNRFVHKTVVLGEHESNQETEIRIDPLPFPFKSGYCYLIVLKYIHTPSAVNKIQNWSRIVQKMAHDIKTPLSTVTLNLKALQTRLERVQLTATNRQDLSDDINMMRTELENIQIMTRNFLKFSNLDKPHFQAFNIRNTIEDVLVKYKPYLNTDLDIQLSFDNDIKPVWADPQQIEIVLKILVENALAALQGRGLISISVVLAQYLDRSFSEYLEIEVADTGPGIKENDKNRIFEPYFTTKPEGTGMGLTIAKKIIEDHDGIIEVHSKPNFGAVFRFSLPVIKEEKNA
jgi:nitrogen-specific signal transduction histidine kinase